MAALAPCWPIWWPQPGNWLNDDCPMSNILDQITAYKLDEIAAAKATKPLAELEAEAKAADTPRGFIAALQAKAADGKAALITEIKKASPSKGLIRADFNPPLIAEAYQQGGAACLSVLTDAPSFQGAPEYLVAARAACSLPVLRKDFMYDPYQVTEARSWGADAILIILAATSDAQAEELYAAATQYGMDTLFEVHDADELDRALALQPRLLGINNRDLRSFETSLQVTRDLMASVPDDVLLVSESGIGGPADVRGLMDDGVPAFLIGESLMRQENIAEATKKLAES